MGRRPFRPRMLTQPEVTHALGVEINALKKDDVEYWTHLAINWGCPVKISQDKNYDPDAGQARSGVNLSREQNWTREAQSKTLLLSRTHIVHR